MLSSIENGSIALDMTKHPKQMRRRKSGWDALTRRSFRFLKVQKAKPAASAHAVAMSARAGGPDSVDVIQVLLGKDSDVHLEGDVEVGKTAGVLPVQDDSECDGGPRAAVFSQGGRVHFKVQCR